MVQPDSKLSQLISALKDGEVVSGEALGRTLGMSRAGAWKQLQKLEELGLPVERVRGVGYRIPGGLDLLSEAEIMRHLTGWRDGGRGSLAISVHGVVDSTNRVAARCLEADPANRGRFHVAECQTAGKGRRGRSWLSPYGASIYLSVAWRFDGGVAAVVGLSLAVGVAMRRAIRRATGIEVQLKWPNDLLAQRKKLGGILVELVGDPSDSCRAVVGVGINVRTPCAVATAIEQPWINLDEVTDQPVARNLLAAAMIHELHLLLASYGPGAFAAYREEWLQGDGFAGATVTLSTPSQSTTGVARGVDDTGALLLEREGRLEVFSGGELSLRVANA